MTSGWLQQRGLRRGTVAVASGMALSASVFLVAPTVATADPAPQTVAQAKAQVDKLQQEAEAADQDYLALKEKLDKSEQDLKDKQADLKTETAQVAKLRSQISKVALAQFQNQGLDARAQLFLTRDPAGFLNQFATIEKINQNQNTALQNYQVEQANLADLQRSTEADITTLKAEKTQLGALKKKADDKVDAATAVLDKLTAEQRQAIQDQETKASDQAAKDAQAATSTNDANDNKSDSKNGSSSESQDDLTGSSAPSSGKGAAAVAFAKAQIGKPYVFGATGPGSYDCSGLTMAAWKAAGVQLDRTSEAQFHDGTPVSRDQLQAGDLVFFYNSSAPSHVGIYVGNGVIIHAPHPGASVEYTQLSYMPFVGARRPA
ncbi:C40 family peptidase [Microlunatus endophyticus]|uniref:C40 family peptidase n=1 Tax=Microlunatus endophyticus TaxID=1716077 RepID=UPI001664CB67|nr:C40 family peptidase [Microlunatus endophyticus]